MLLRPYRPLYYTYNQFYMYNDYFKHTNSRYSHYLSLLGGRVPLRRVDEPNYNIFLL